MFNKLKTLLMVGLLALLSGCGLHFANQSAVTGQFSTMKLVSSEPYDFLSRQVREQLKLHQVTLVERDDVPQLRLKGSTISSNVVSVFKQGREAENLLTLNVRATVYVPGKGEYPIDVNNSRTFFNDSRAALAKSVEQDVIYDDMRRQAAKQLLIKLVTLQQQLNNAQ
ncbi:LPS assembly lipoprotein LptE [Spirabiliibacterium falconis]|uniref:LPS assembly lipoprotein LptE n=1 Tax=Spirabiliibacterium falconis TaxID=572023 RepID=UPI001AADEB06|nr:LPS assembly lipoprotein LptE [Spirabiliibacterium falconis]MBE2894757.1 RlpB protein [Spirabiliibacterium falconis]